MFTKLSR